MITLFQAVALVILVVFVFLQNVRSTLIPTLTIPVSLIGTLAFMLMFGFSINMLTLLGLATIDPVFGLLGATPELMPLIHDYMGTWYWVVPLDMVLWTTLASIRARGNTLFESKVIIAAALLNLVLDPLLIFGLLGFPALGIVGAGISTVVATVLGDAGHGVALEGIQRGRVPAARRGLVQPHDQVAAQVIRRMCVDVGVLTDDRGDQVGAGTLGADQEERRRLCGCWRRRH